MSADPRNRDYRAQLAYVRANELVESGDRAGARAQLEWALQLAPKDKAIRQLLWNVRGGNGMRRHCMARVARSH